MLLTAASAGVVPSACIKDTTLPATNDAATPALAREALRELAHWGHADCDVQLEWIRRKPGAPSSLSCLFWCESCHVSQLLVLSETRVR